MRTDKGSPGHALGNERRLSRFLRELCVFVLFRLVRNAG